VRAPAAALAAFLLAIGLAACGGGSSSSSTASTAAPSAASTATTTPPAGANPAGKAAAKPAAGETGGKASRPSPPSGPAAAFHTPHGDNSIPNYGAEAPASQRAGATAALRRYLVARAGGEWSTACAYLGGTVRSQLETLVKASGGKAKGCAAAYAILSAHIPAAQRANPLSGALAVLRVKGEKAFALFYGPHNQKYMMPMAREGGAWKVNQIAPVAYPLGAPTHAP
jgi:hypothetical protein